MQFEIRAPLCTNFSTTAWQLFSGQTEEELTEKQDGNHVLQMMYMRPENSSKTSKMIPTYPPVWAAVTQRVEQVD